MGVANMQTLIPVGHAENKVESSLLSVSGGHPFIDMTPALRHPIFRRVIKGGLAQFDALAPQALELAMQRPEFQGPKGLSLSFSVLRGIAKLGMVRVIHDPQSETLNPGEILVARFTDPGWTPLFINAGGLVMEVGGQLTHGSVVAREYGIPAVVGVRGATTTLHTGQRVRVDGNRGVVEVLGNGA